MIQSFLLSMLIYCIVSMPFYISIRYLYMRKRKINRPRELVMLLFFLYCMSIFSQTIIPDFYVIEGKIILNASSLYMRGNFIPFQTIRLYYEQLGGPIAQIAFYNLAGNIILFIPFGYFIPLLFPKLRGWRKMLAVALCIPLFIECTQYFIGRSIDIDDVFLNAIAIIIGFILFSMSNIRKK